MSKYWKQRKETEKIQPSINLLKCKQQYIKLGILALVDGQDPNPENLANHPFLLFTDSDAFP